MKKIGILTYHNADNQGAVLQAYALCRYMIEKSKMEVEIIDYRCDAIEKSKKASLSDIKSIKGALSYPLLSCYYGIKRQGFYRFRKQYLTLSKKKYTRKNMKEMESDYDVFIVGSDQVWNLECSGSDKTYFLDFIINQKKYSYAASMGESYFAETDKRWIKSCLQQFGAISVRDSKTLSEIKALGIEKADIHLDPVFLLEENIWRALAHSSFLKEKYIFVYLIQKDVDVMKAAVQFAKEYNYKLVSNKSSICYFIHNSPIDFLTWIYNAECVFTNSFHGTAFSLLYNKPLLVDVNLVNGKKNNRVSELLYDLEADNCILQGEGFKSEKVNANNAINKIVKGSKEYLNRIIWEINSTES